MKLLHLDSSIQANASASRTLSAAIVDRLRTLVPGIEVARRDLATDPLPHLTLDRFASDDGQAVLDQFLDADVVVIGAPMYNFGVPTQLKGWFDHVLIAGKTFRYTAEGPEGLVGGKQVIVATSRGGLYGAESPAAPAEHTESHLRTMLAIMGIAEPQFVVAEGIALGAEAREAAMAAALSAIEVLDPPLAAAA